MKVPAPLVEVLRILALGALLGVVLFVGYLAVSLLH